MTQRLARRGGPTHSRFVEHLLGARHHSRQKSLPSCTDSLSPSQSQELGVGTTFGAVARGLASWEGAEPGSRAGLKVLWGCNLGLSVYCVQTRPAEC